MAPTISPMTTPRQTVIDAFAQGFTVVPVVRRLVADDLTPVAALDRVRDAAHHFLFESVVGGERVARYSMLGAEPRARIEGGREGLFLLEGGDHRRLEGDPIAAIRGYLSGLKVAPTPGLPRFSGGLVGAFAYDLIRAYEPLPDAPPDVLGLPEVSLGRYDTVAVFDHSHNHLLLISHADAVDGPGAYDRAVEAIDRLQARLTATRAPSLVQAPPPSELPVRQHTSREQFHESVLKIKELIKAGDAFQVVLSQRLSAPCPHSAYQVYRSLRSLNPSPYLFCLNQGGHALIGASPELLVRVEDGRVAVRPIAGTALRGKDPEEDERLARDLLADPKERAEHAMLIDLGRNDVGRVCAPGSVRLTERMVIERYSHVQHIVSHVEGRLREGCDALEALKVCHPAGTVSGAPKVRAMQIIDSLEPVRRSFYSGAVGYIDFKGNLDTAIALRTAILANGEVHVQAGAGVVADSTPEGEYEETLRKARATLLAISRAGAF